MDTLLYAIDWANTWRPAIDLLLSGLSPYACKWFFGPPWTLLPLLPVYVLPAPWDRLLLFAGCLVAFGVAAVRLGARPVALVVFLLSPPVVHSLSTGNLDSLVLLGATLPPPVGLFLIAIKPQLGLPLALLWAVAAWRSGGVRQVLRTFAPVGLALVLSFALYGLWPLSIFHTGQADSSLVDRPWNASLWPWSIPFGLALVVYALRHPRESGDKRSEPAALSAGPFLSPYLSFQSYSASLVALVRRPWLLAAVSAGLWALALAQM